MKYLLWRPGVPALIAALALPALADPGRLQTGTRYDAEYPVIAYSDVARDNRIWRLQQRLDSGEVKLQWEPGYGYLRSLLQALQINPDSQVLVFSRTSLQIEHISPRTPRAVYFNDDTYVGYVQNSPLIELTAIDARKGAVFYAFDNRTDYPPAFEREGGRCLTCHDTYAMGGGGVPRVMVLSTPVDDPADTRNATAGEDVDDTTPFGRRWGGWYVTGSTGTRTHLGNLPLREGRGGEKLRELRAGSHNIDSLRAWFDTRITLTDQSDVVALTVLEHQTELQNQITRVGYKVSTILARDGDAALASASAGAGSRSGVLRSWEDIAPNDHERLQQMMEPLVQALFLHKAAPFEDRMVGRSGFAERFAALGPRDSKGRSLRELDLQQRLFRYPLSYLVYSEQFDALPAYARDYVDARIVEVLQGRDTTGLTAALTAAQRTAITEILIDTKPRLAALLRQQKKQGD
jgi:hypothetical protein